MAMHARGMQWCKRGHDPRQTDKPAHKNSVNLSFFIYKLALNRKAKKRQFLQAGHILYKCYIVGVADMRGTRICNLYRNQMRNGDTIFTL